LALRNAKARFLLGRRRAGRPSGANRADRTAILLDFSVTKAKAAKARRVGRILCKFERKFERRFQGNLHKVRGIAVIRPQSAILGKAGTMFLIRTAFWLSVVIMLLPADPRSGTPAPRVSLLEAVTSARMVAADLSNFCERNPDVCVTGAAAFRVFAEKAQNGARMLFRYFEGTAGTGDQDDGNGTLTERDRLPPWQGPAAPNTA
jgi:hypothetical protein